MKQLRGLDLKRAQLVPSSVFASPEEVVRHEGLSPAQKLAILRRWEFDARRTAGYAGADPSMQDLRLLFRIRRALQGLTYCDAAIRPIEPDVLALPLGDDDEIVPPSVIASRTASGKL